MIELIGKVLNLLEEPSYIKVFKHTCDYVKDYICYGMVAVACVVLSVRIFSTLESGEVTCVIRGFVNASAWHHKLFFPESLESVVEYAVYSDKCADSTISRFVQYLSFIMVIQALVIVCADKIPFKLGKISIKVERFYNIIIVHSLFGKDTALAEDVSSLKQQLETLSHRSQQQEVCNALRRSNLIHRSYITKNVFQAFILFVFAGGNIYFLQSAEPKDQHSKCILHIPKDDGIGLNSGDVLFECDGKQMEFYFLSMKIYLPLQIIANICCLGSIYWYYYGRVITELLKRIESESDEDYKDTCLSGKDMDFMFLFDLLAHSIGLEEALRILSHSDETFQKMCKPRIKKSESYYIQITEDKLKVLWRAAHIEKCLNKYIPNVNVNSYDVTIYPAETSQNTITRKAKPDEELENDDYYSAKFLDLYGGKTEYTVTIACVIGQSRMKGAQIVTTLIPNGPVSPSSGFVKSMTTTEVEIAWEKPKSEFSKYFLAVDPCSCAEIDTDYLTRRGSTVSSISLLSAQHLFRDPEIFNLSNMFNVKFSNNCWVKELKSKEDSFTIDGLSPNALYLILLKTVTGEHDTRNPICEIVLTRPEGVKSPDIWNISADRAEIHWTASINKMCNNSYIVRYSSKHERGKKEFIVEASTEKQSFVLENLTHATKYTVSLTYISTYGKIKQMSEEKHVEFITKPLTLQNLQVENYQYYNLRISWDCSPYSSHNTKFRLSLCSAGIRFETVQELPGDQTVFNFHKLPEVTGTGEVFTVKIVLCHIPDGSDTQVDSDPIIEEFVTKPLPPTNLRVGLGVNELIWKSSLSSKVRKYRVRYRAGVRGSQPIETIVEQTQGSDFASVVLQDMLLENVLYKINIFSMVEFKGEFVESNELHEKIMKRNGGLVIFFHDHFPVTKEDIYLRRRRLQSFIWSDDSGI